MKLIRVLFDISLLIPAFIIGYVVEQLCCGYKTGKEVSIQDYL